MDQPPIIPAPSHARSARKVRRCNADYRWTVPKIHAFLDALAESGRVADAARAVGMSRQAAYKLRARLDGPKFRAAFEGARKKGIKARAAASIARSRSRWDGPGIATLEYLRQGYIAPAQGDTGHAQGDTAPAQGDSRHAQGDGARRQGDALSCKATKLALDTVTSVTRPARRPISPRPAQGAIGERISLAPEDE